MKRIEDKKNSDLDLEKLLSEKVMLKEDIFVNKEIVGDTIMARIEALRKRSFWFGWAAASAILVLLSASMYLLGDREFASEKDRLAVWLPDGSQIQMQENSRLSYNRIVWIWDRTVDFKGTAHFTVAKGKRFTVRTEFGNVEVLGTEFQVEAAKQSLEVECFSGMVSVTTSVGDQILRTNEKIRCSPEGMIFTPAQEPLPDFIELNHVPLTQVITKMEELFHVTIVPKDICQGIIYDGLLPTGNLDEALEIVMSSCGMTYLVNDNQIIISRYDE